MVLNSKQILKYAGERKDLEGLQLISGVSYRQLGSLSVQ